MENTKILNDKEKESLLWELKTTAKYLEEDNLYLACLYAKDTFVSLEVAREKQRNEEKKQEKRGGKNE